MCGVYYIGLRLDMTPIQCCSWYKLPLSDN